MRVGRFHRTQPDLALLLVLSSGLAKPEVIFPALMNGTPPAIEGKALEMYEGFSAPYRGLPDEALNGYRKFPLSIPLDSYTNGNAAAQTPSLPDPVAMEQACLFYLGLC